MYWYSIMLYALHIFAHKLNTCWVVFWLFVKQVISCKTIQTLINMVYLQAYFHTDQTRFHMKSLIIVWGLIFSGAGFVQKCLSPTSVAWVWCWPAAMCGYSLLLVIANGSEGFPSGSHVFLTPWTPASSNFNSTRIDTFLEASYWRQMCFFFKINVLNFFILKERQKAT